MIIFLDLDVSMGNTRNRMQSPSASKLTNLEVQRIKQQAVEAEKRYKKRLKAVVKLQRFWRRIRPYATQKRLEWQAKQAIRQVRTDIEQDYDFNERMDDLNVDVTSIKIPDFQSNYNSNKRWGPSVESGRDSKIRTDKFTTDKLVGKDI